MLLASFYINHKKLFQLVATGDNTKNTTNTVIQRNTKNTVFLLKVMTSAEIAGAI